MLRKNGWGKEEQTEMRLTKVLTFKVLSLVKTRRGSEEATVISFSKEKKRESERVPL